jgi:hypothetical protein
MSDALSFLREPSLVFGNGQALESPKDGLFLFGPLEEASASKAIRLGVVGTSDGIRRFRAWSDRLRGFIPAVDSKSPQHRPFPGFENIFGAEWPEAPVCELQVRVDELSSAIRISDRHQAIYKMVELYKGPIERFLNEEDERVDLWFVVIPEEVYTYGRPLSIVPKSERIQTAVLMDKKSAKAIAQTPSFFEEDNLAAVPYQYELNFHNQLKARLLEGLHLPVAQIVRETTLAPHEFMKRNGYPLRRVQDPATVAWHLCTAAYFKAAGRPWRLARVREGVCYVGLVFKQVVNAEEGTACCGAQMFLHSGDGLVFRGAVGPWRSPDTHEYHLSVAGAGELIGMVIEAYKSKHGKPPAEMFIHGQTFFNEDEWTGFRSAVPSETNLVGVRIRSSHGLKLYRPGDNPVARGTAFLQSERGGFLWTRGYIPYLQTYPGRETPNPLRIEVTRGNADLSIVMEDVLNLTKLNFNACIYGDGLPVTLRFADAVGEILTAGPERKGQPPLPFRHYI